MTEQTPVDTPLARIRSEAERAEEAARLTTVNECVTAHSAMAAGLRIAEAILGSATPEVPTPGPAPVAHACPQKGSGVMPCCALTPFEVPRTDRISIDPFEVTCGQRTPTPVPADVRDQIAAAIHRYDYEAGLSGNDIPSKHHRGEADAVLRVPAIAEALTAVERVRAECDRIEAAVRANPQDPDFDGAYLAAIGHIRAALEPQETP